MRRPCRRTRPEHLSCRTLISPHLHALLSYLLFSYSLTLSLSPPTPTSLFPTNTPRSKHAALHLSSQPHTAAHLASITPSSLTRLARLRSDRSSLTYFTIFLLLLLSYLPYFSHYHTPPLSLYLYLLFPPSSSSFFQPPHSLLSFPFLFINYAPISLLHFLTSLSLSLSSFPPFSLISHSFSPLSSYLSYPFLSLFYLLTPLPLLLPPSLSFLSPPHLSSLFHHSLITLCPFLLFSLSPPPPPPTPPSSPPLPPPPPPPPPLFPPRRQPRLNERRPALDHVLEHPLLHHLAHALGQLEHQPAVRGGLGPVARRLDRLAELDPPLRRQGYRAQRPEPREQRGEGKNGAPIRRASSGDSPSLG